MVKIAGKTRECAYCGESFTAYYKNQIYCCTAHQIKNKHKTHKEKLAMQEATAAAEKEPKRAKASETPKVRLRPNETKCPTCGKIINKREYQDVWYCSLKCFLKRKKEVKQHEGTEDLRDMWERILCGEA